MHEHFTPSMPILPLILTLVLLACALTGCSSAPKSDGFDADYVFVYLKSGPTSGQGDKDARQQMFAGHMANIKRLADAGSLVVAGPFSKPADPTWRGILICDVPTNAEALDLAATDPGVQAGEFIADPHEMRSSSTLRRTMDHERAMQAELKSQPQEPGAPPPNIRAYVMVTAEDFTRARDSINASPWRDRIIWSGSFNHSPRGVFVLDALTTDEVRSTLPSPGPCSIDTWYSTAALTRLNSPTLNSPPPKSP